MNESEFALHNFADLELGDRLPPFLHPMPIQFVRHS
jgi:hypothetical protein